MAICNLYSMTRARSEAARLGRALSDRNNNQPPMPGVYPDYPAPIILKGADGAREMRDVRWGMPSSKKALYDAAAKRADKLRAKGQDVDFPQLLRMEPDKGTTNIRNTSSPHWKPWLGAANRCLVPFTAFSEPDQAAPCSRSGSRKAKSAPSPSSPASGPHGPACARSRKARSPATCSAS
jgi:putative SOS response-associated peptidase YedK